jgi:hypothetical protein
MPRRHRAIRMPHPDAGDSVHAMAASPPSVTTRSRASTPTGSGNGSRQHRRVPSPRSVRAHRRRPLEPDVPGDRRAGRHFALRRPPLSHVLPTAHDMAREYRVISALGPRWSPCP